MSWKRKTIDGQNQFTEAMWIPKGKFTVSAVMTDNPTVTVQRSTEDNSQGKKPSLSTWKDVKISATADNITANAELVGDEGAGAWYRIGVKTGNFDSNDVTVEIGV